MAAANEYPQYDWQPSRVAARLQEPLPPEYTRLRPVGGGKQASYVGSDTVIHLANDIFGFTHWSCDIKNLDTKYCVQDKEGRWNATIICTSRVTLMDNGDTINYHEDVGVGTAMRSPTIDQALELATKAAVTDARKRCLRIFGDQLGNCVNSSDYQQSAKEHRVRAGTGSVGASAPGNRGPSSASGSGPAPAAAFSATSRPASTAAATASSIAAPTARPAAAATVLAAATVQVATAMAAGVAMPVAQATTVPAAGSTTAVGAGVVMAGGVTRYTSTSLLSVGGVEAASVPAATVSPAIAPNSAMTAPGGGAKASAMGASPSRAAALQPLGTNATAAAAAATGVSPAPFLPQPNASTTAAPTAAAPGSGGSPPEASGIADDASRKRRVEENRQQALAKRGRLVGPSTAGSGVTTVAAVNATAAAAATTAPTAYPHLQQRSSHANEEHAVLLALAAAETSAAGTNGVRAGPAMAPGHSFVYNVSAGDSPNIT